MSMKRKLNKKLGIKFDEKEESFKVERISFFFRPSQNPICISDGRTLDLPASGGCPDVECCGRCCCEASVPSAA